MTFQIRLLVVTHNKRCNAILQEGIYDIVVKLDTLGIDRVETTTKWNYPRPSDRESISLDFVLLE